MRRQTWQAAQAEPGTQESCEPSRGSIFHLEIDLNGVLFLRYMTHPWVEVMFGVKGGTLVGAIKIRAE